LLFQKLQHAVDHYRLDIRGVFNRLQVFVIPRRSWKVKAKPRGSSLPPRVGFWLAAVSTARKLGVVRWSSVKTSGKQMEYKRGQKNDRRSACH
jgi:hypothetical protein